MNYKPLLITILLMLTALHSVANVIYRETFENDTGEDRNLVESGWFIINGNGGTDFTKGQPVNRVPGADFRGGSNQALDGVNNNPTSDNFRHGYLQEAWGGDWNRHTLYYTDEFPVETSTQDVSSISWLQGSGSNPVKVAIRIDADQWFVSEEDFVGGKNPYFLPTGGEEQELDFPSAKWIALEMRPGQWMRLGEATELPEGDITAFGWYLPKGKKKGSSVAFDDFTIYAISSD